MYGLTKDTGTIKCTPEKSNELIPNGNFLRVPLPFPKHHFGALHVSFFGGAKMTEELPVGFTFPVGSL